MYSRTIIAMIIATGLLAATSVRADVQVFACEPEWAALASEIGGGDIETSCCTS